MRRGLSITEVLIAIFIMAIGMISLLALFPIGMIRMSQAIRTNRVALTAGNSQALAELHRLRADWNSTLQLSAVLDAVRKEPLLYDAVTNNVFLFPYDPSTTAGQLHTCPVYVDPVGSSLWEHLPSANVNYANYRAGDPVGRAKVGGETPADTSTILAANIGIPRSFSAYAPYGSHRSVLYRWYTLEDEVTFTASGLAVSNPAERERRISWAYLWRRPVWQDEGVVDVSLVLYSNRMIAGLGNSNGTANTGNIFRQEFKAGGPAGAFAGTTWTNRAFIKNSRQAALNWTSPQLAQAVQPGYWVLDATMLDNNSPLGDNQWHLNGYFYQITNVGDVDANGQQTIELDRPARADGYVAVIPLGVVDVIEKSDGRRPY
jgi:hypothetical protein